MLYINMNIYYIKNLFKSQYSIRNTKNKRDKKYVKKQKIMRRITLNLLYDYLQQN